ncbi:trans-sialidase, putative, partial [Trypanosoma cruzi]
MAAFCAAFFVGVRHGRRKLHAVPLLTVVRITGAMQLRPSEVCAQRRYIALLGRHDCAVAGIAVRGVLLLWRVCLTVDQHAATQPWIKSDRLSWSVFEHARICNLSWAEPFAHTKQRGVNGYRPH